MSIKRYLPLVLLVALAYLGVESFDFGAATTPDAPANARSSTTSADMSRRADTADDWLATAFAARATDLQVSGAGVVVRTLADDNAGSRHQRFLLRLDSGQTLLVAHNIDLAPRIDSLQTGDTVEFNGVYEWNDKGGVIHWTHDDPAGQHAAGWLQHNGKTYQ